MRAPSLESRRFTVVAVGLTLAVAACFYVPALVAAPDAWPAPLDDVYIHHDFARALAAGHPFEWIAGQGYSSGETSPAYALLLAVGYLVGFRGAWLGVWGAMIACASVVFMLRALFDLSRTAAGPGRSTVVGLGALLLLACGTLDFAWWSGMEVAFFGAVAASLLVAVDRARRASPVMRSSRQWWVGLVGALLVLVRPEAAVLVALAMFVVARRVGASSALAACARVALPGALVTLALAAQNRALSGDAPSAGALLKLLSSNPFATDEDRARDYVVSLVMLVRSLRRDLGDSSGRFAFALPLLAIASLFSRRTRALGAISLGGAVTYALLASWNGAARFQNFRHYMPSVTLLLFASALGVAALVSARVRMVALFGGALGVLGAALGAMHVADAASFYARACRNIHDQQVTVGRRLAREAPRDAILLVGDAGAIPYFSERHAVDALGLGGYHGVPFVRAAVEGEAATLELIERLPVHERPTILALYPNWFPGITGTFGHETSRVTITDNVICGGVTKGIYDADWTPLRGDADPPDERFVGDVLDEVDVADVVSERAHAYASPAPRGGWTLFEVRVAGNGVTRFDAGRGTPEGEEESFEVRADAPANASLVLRVDDVRADVSVSVGHAAVALKLPDEVAEGAWARAEAVLPMALHAGDRIHLRVTRGTLHDFHAWLIRGKP